MVILKRIVGSKDISDGPRMYSQYQWMRTYVHRILTTSSSVDSRVNCCMKIFSNTGATAITILFLIIKQNFENFMIKEDIYRYLLPLPC